MSSIFASSRSIAAGLSAGVGLAIPVAAFAVTAPFDTAHSLVSAAAAPFGIGALAGIGVFAAASAAIERGAGGEDAEAREPGGERFAGAERPHRARGSHQADGGHTGGFFARRADRAASRAAMPDDVPVIARAQGAPSEEEAWAEIDALLSDDSPISCDPARSKDIYEITLDELRRGAAEREAEAARTAGAQPAAATPVSPAGADTTATFMALAGVEPTGKIQVDEAELDTASARRAALGSLDVVPGDGLDEADAETVPMADYSGREGVWADALAILMDEDAAAEPDAYVPRHMASAASITSPTLVPPSPERALAVDEGARATQMHAHVNGLVEEELERSDSESVRSTTREYLRVIQGGTASMPRIAIEA